MGQRANFVLVCDGRHSIHYSHYAANSFDADLFWGPDHFRSFVEAQDETQTWLDHTWAEGGALVDFDTKTLLWFGGMEDLKFEPAYRRIFCRVLPHNWPGWTVRLERTGLDAFIAHLGLDAALVASSSSVEMAHPQRSEPPTHLRHLDGGSPKMHGFGGTLVSVRSRHGLAIVAALSGIGWFLEIGPKLLDLPTRNDESKRDVLTEDLPVSDPIWARGASSIMELSRLPRAGIAIDIDSSSLSWWREHPQRSVPGTQAWAGWSCIDWGDRFEEHLALVGDRVSVALPSERQLVEQMVGWLLRHGGEDYAGSFAATLDALRATGASVTDVNPMTSSHTPVETPTIDAKRVIISRALSAAGLSPN